MGFEVKIENEKTGYVIEGYAALAIILGIWLAPAAIVFAVMV